VLIQRRAGWAYLRELASSPDATLRCGALSRSYAWVENALQAVRVPDPHLSIATRILGLLSHQTLSRGLDVVRLRAAIEARHLSNHQDSVPAPAECVEAVETLRAVWNALNRRFVRPRRAVSLASRMASRPHVDGVGIYGSFARQNPEPNDLDFLVFDDGEYSDSIELGSYADGTFNAVRHTQEALECLGMEDEHLFACAKCRWLDILIIDGTRFGTDQDYTSELCSVQPDPWFFVNIARDLLEFNRDTNSFHFTSRFPFPRLREIHRNLADLGLEPVVTSLHNALGDDEEE
jgi:hypothetical protein